MNHNFFKKGSGGTPNYHFSTNDIRIILDQIHDPCLLVNLDSKTIIGVNDSFAEFTGIGSDEIAGLGIERVVENCDFERVADGSVNYWNISRKNKNAVEAAVATRYIGKNEKLALMQFPLIDDKLIEEHPVSDQMLEKIIEITNQAPEVSLEELLRRLLDCSQKIFPIKFTVLYLQENKTSDPVKSFSDEDPFPAMIPALEMRRLQQIEFWEPGKRVLSEIHRVGRMKNYGMLVTIPIVLPEDKKGIIILVFDDPKVRDRFGKTIQSFSEWIAVLIKIQSSTSNLSERSSRFKGEIDKYTQFYENASDCAVILSEENTIIDFNKNTCEFLGYSPIEMLNQNAGVIFENSEIIDAIARSREGNTILQTEPRKIHRRDGRSIPVTFRIIPITVAGKPQKLLIIKDATAKVETEKKILSIENKAALGEVVADFAHEVRNPINNIATGLQLLEQKVADQDSRKEIVLRMQEDCLRMNDLMESVLSYSRQKIENFKELDPELLIRRIINRMNQKFSSANVTCLIKPEIQKMHIQGDQRSLEQAFINLINNGFDAIKQSGGTISIILTQEENHPEGIEIRIADTGPGIPPEIREKLFEPFVTDKPKGTGLGLAITKRIIEAHHGKIELETFPGGTIFKVLLPIKNQQGDLA